MKICIVQSACFSVYKSVNDVNKHYKDDSMNRQISLSEYEGDDWICMSVKNHQDYASKHSYEYHLNKESSLPTDRNISWYRIPAIFDAIEKYSPDWIFFSDVDTLFMEDEIKLETFIDRAEFLGKDLILASQGPSDGGTLEGGEVKKRYDRLINFGSFFIKNSKWSKKWLKKLWNFPSESIAHEHLLYQEYYDNCVANIFLDNNIFETKANSLVLSNTFFNAFFPLEYWKNWLVNELGPKPKKHGDVLAANTYDIFYKEGDFRIHFTALNFEQRQVLMREYAFRKDNPDKSKWTEINYTSLVRGRKHKRK